MRGGGLGFCPGVGGIIWNHMGPPTYGGEYCFSISLVKLPETEFFNYFFEMLPLSVAATDGRSGDPNEDYVRVPVDR